MKKPKYSYLNRANKYHRKALSLHKQFRADLAYYFESQMEKYQAMAFN